MQVSVIIAAAGSGQRLGGDMPKQFQLLGGKPLLAYALDVFNQLEIIDNIYVSVPTKYVNHTNKIANLYGFTKIKKIVPGGQNRAESIHAAIQQLNNTDIVLIHDGARPFVSDKLIESVVQATKKYGAAVAGIPITDTIKKVDDDNKILTTLDRKILWQIQTPQGFTYEIIQKAYAKGQKDNILECVTDDSMLVERMGHKVQMVMGHSNNIKITTKEDLLLGEIILHQKNATTTKRGDEV